MDFPAVLLLNEVRRWLQHALNKTMLTMHHYQILPIEGVTPM